MKLTDNTILITGGGSGIGRGIAESLHRLGNQIIIAGRRRDRLQAVAEANPGMHYLQVDQGDAASIARLAAELADRHPDLNTVINNAGVMSIEDLLAGNGNAAETTVAVNLLGPIRLTAMLLPGLLAQRRAAIINVSSALAVVPKATVPTYCATKAALHSYTQSLRWQLRDTSVEVIEVLPPRVETQIQQGLEDAPNIMSLDSFVGETISLLNAEPPAGEVVVDSAKRVRFAERDGRFDEVFQAVNPVR